MIFINLRVPSSWKNCITRAYKPPRPASVFTIIRREGDDILYKYYDMMRVCFFPKYISLSQQQRTPPCVYIILYSRLGDDAFRDACDIFYHRDLYIYEHANWGVKHDVKPNPIIYLFSVHKCPGKYRRHSAKMFPYTYRKIYI